MVDAMRQAARHGALIGVAGALLMLPPGVVSAQASGGAVLQLAQAGPGSRGAPAAPQAGGSDTDRQIADLKKQLKITPQQEPQFNAFAEVMRKNAQDADALMRQAPQTQNAVEGLKQAQQFTETQAEGMKRLVPALQALYDSLSDPQKKVADRVLGGGEEAGGAPGGPSPGGRKR